MAVAGINNVSVLESSYRGDNYSSVSMRWANQERPITRTSFIRKMWRDLEGESGSKENGRQQTSGMANRGAESLCSCSSEGGAESEDRSRDANEVENEQPHDQNQARLDNGQENNRTLCLQRSPAFGVAEKRRVRQVFREWGSKSFNGNASNVSYVNNCSRPPRHSENECKRVKIVREWIESSTQQADTSHSGFEDQSAESGCQIEEIRDGFGVNLGVRAQTSIRKLYGRQALLDLLTKFQQQRKRELEILLEDQLVSNFAHRNRIQALLRGRFLWNQRFVQDEKSTSIAANELGLLRRTHAVSDLRKGFLSTSEDYNRTPDEPHSDTLSDIGMKYHDENSQEPRDDSKTNLCEGPEEYVLLERESQERVFEIEERDQPFSNVEFTQTTLQNQDGSVERNQGPGELEVNEPSELDTLETNAGGSTQVEEGMEPVTEVNDGRWHHVTSTESDESFDPNSFENEQEWFQETTESDFQESHEEWYENGPEETFESWFGETSNQETAPVQRTESTNRFYTSDDQNRPELQELMSRRSVSNLLQSDFRVRLDQLLQSYIERQDQAVESDEEWMLDRDENDNHPSPPAAPQTPEDDTFHPVTDWQRPDFHPHYGTELEVVNGLRVDMVMLQEQMNTMQKMLETCMNMQLKLKDTVHHEVSSALNRSSYSGEEAQQCDGKEGVCFLCCDGSFSSPPDRCGHVYICAKCAEKINWSNLKESIRHP